MNDVEMNMPRMHGLFVCLAAAVVISAVGVRSRADFTFGRAVNLGPPINSPCAEGFDCLSPDGLEMYFDSDRPGGLGGWDIWIVRRPAVDRDWGKPVNLGPFINSERDDTYASLSGDGLELYITADNRPGGHGSSDIWVARRESPSADWGRPENLGPRINSPAPEGMSWISADGLELHFVAFGRPGGYGGNDLWLSRRATKADSWGPPTNLGPEVNSSYSETEPSLSADGLTLYFGSERPGGHGGSFADIWGSALVALVDLNEDGAVDEKDIVIMMEQWDRDEPRCDVAPMPWGDGVVDVQDLAVLIEHKGGSVLDPTLTAHWTLDEAQGDIAYDSAGPNHGVVHGHPIWRPNGGVEGGSLEFDGVEDYVSTGFVIDPSKGAFSIFAWINGGGPGQVILSQAGDADWLKVDEVAGTLATGLAPRLLGTALVSGTVITDGQWRRVGLCWEWPSRVLYVDGEEVARDVQSAMPPWSCGLHIGANGNLAVGDCFCGLIDDVRVYRRAVKPWKDRNGADKQNVGGLSEHGAASPAAPIHIFAATGRYGGGCGTPDDPYQIWTAEQMNTIGVEPTDWDKCFTLMADIDLSALDSAGGRPEFNVIAPDTDRIEGFQGTPFTGVFDGGGHTISNLTISGGEYLGLFGELAAGAQVRDLGIVNAQINGSGAFIGGLAGFNYRGYVVGCFCTGNIKGTENVGLLIGCNDGAVAHCYSAGTVYGTTSVGGLVGFYPENHAYSSMTHCYSAAAVHGDEDTGGLVGSGYGVAARCFWDRRTSGQSRSAVGTGRTTVQMQDIRTFANAGWDFVGSDDDGTSQIWLMPEPDGYPVLAVFHGYSPPQLDGAGTPDDPYRISSKADLGAVIHYSPRDHYRLTASVDLGGTCWGAAVIPWLSGTFDGGGHVISHLTIKGASHLGLFGRLLPGSQVRDLGVMDVNIPGEGDYVGGLVGWNAGIVANCCARGNVSGDSSIGVLAGANGDCLWYGRGWSCLLGTISNCYTRGRARADYDVGGLVGYNLGASIHCYSTAAVSSPGTTTGGLVGAGALCAYEQGASCHYGVVTGCFWDIETSGQVTDAGGTGKTTALMQTADTFLEAGWDLVGEEANGTDDVWWIDEGRDYPRLWWERIEEIELTPQHEHRR